MKITTVALAILSMTSLNTIVVRAEKTGDIISSWVQYTGADMDICKEQGALLASSQGKNKDDAFCHFTAEVRAIFDDPDMELTDCPSDILEVNGKSMDMEVRVLAADNFTNIVST